MNKFWYGLFIGFLGGVLAALTFGPLSGMRFLLEHWR